MLYPIKKYTQEGFTPIPPHAGATADGAGGAWGRVGGGIPLWVYFHIGHNILKMHNLYMICVCTDICEYLYINKYY